MTERVRFNKPASKQTPTPAKKLKRKDGWRAFSRERLLNCCLDEYFASDGDSIVRLYASLFARALFDHDPLLQRGFGRFEDMLDWFEINLINPIKQARANVRAEKELDQCSASGWTPKRSV